MKAWLRALFSQVIVSSWWLLSAASTLSTFFFHGWAGKVRPILAVSSIVGFAWANYRVFQKQQSEISALGKNTQLPQPRVSDLRITAHNGSRYILRPVQNVARGDFSGMFLELHLMIENQGRRDATVNHFQVEVVELNRQFTNLAPEERLNAIAGRHCVHGLNPQGLSRTGLIRIEAENTTNCGTLIFDIPEVNLRTFAECDLRMDGPERKFPPLHCRLTLTDTTQTSATQTFELREE